MSSRSAKAFIPPSSYERWRNRPMDVLETVLVGLGRIGIGYDEDSWLSNTVKSHAKAILGSPRYRLIAGVDPHLQRREVFEKLTGVAAFETIDGLQESPDVFIVATPTGTHAQAVEAVMARSPRGLLLEKPLGEQRSDTDRIVESVNRADTRVAVNYMRAYVPAYQSLGRQIRSGALGRFVKGDLRYSNGLLHTGSHYIQLLQTLFNAPGEVKTVGPTGLNGGDSPHFEMLIAGGEMSICGERGVKETTAELKLLFTDGAIAMSDCCNRIQVRKGNGDWREVTSDMERSQNYVVENFAQHVQTGKEVACSLEAALVSLRVCWQVLGHE